MSVESFAAWHVNLLIQKTTAYGADDDDDDDDDVMMLIFWSSDAWPNYWYTFDQLLRQLCTPPFLP